MNKVIGSQFANHPLRDSEILDFCLEPYTGFHMARSVHEKTKNYGKEVEYKTNNLGFFSAQDFHYYQNRSDLGVEDLNIIVLLGGSGAQGWGATNPDLTIASRLEWHMNNSPQARQKKYRVINLASGSWISSQELISYIFFGKNLLPKVVVQLSGRNDFFVSAMHGEAPPNYFMFESLNDLFTEFGNLDKPAIWDYVFPAVYLNRIKKKLSVLEKEKTPSVSGEMIKTAAKYFNYNTNIIAELSEMHYLIAQPTLFLNEQYAPWERRARFGNISIENLRTSLRLFYGLTFNENTAEKTHRFRDVSLMNFFSHCELSEAKNLLIDDCHFTDAGQEFVARHICNLILGINN